MFFTIWFSIFFFSVLECFHFYKWNITLRIQYVADKNGTTLKQNGRGSITFYVLNLTIAPSSCTHTLGNLEKLQCPLEQCLKTAEPLKLRFAGTNIFRLGHTNLRFFVFPSFQGKYRSPTIQKIYTHWMRNLGLPVLLLWSVLSLLTLNSHSTLKNENRFVEV